MSERIIRPRRTRKAAKSLNPTPKALRDRFREIVIPPTADVIKGMALSKDEEIEDWRANLFVAIDDQHKAWRLTAKSTVEAAKRRKAHIALRKDITRSVIWKRSSMAIHNRMEETWAARLNYTIVIAELGKLPQAEPDRPAAIQSASLESAAARNEHIRSLEIFTAWLMDEEAPE